MPRVALVTGSRWKQPLVQVGWWWKLVRRRERERERESKEAKVKGRGKQVRKEEERRREGVENKETRPIPAGGNEKNWQPLINLFDQTALINACPVYDRCDSITWNQPMGGIVRWNHATETLLRPSLRLEFNIVQSWCWVTRKIIYRGNYSREEIGIVMK